MKTLGVIVLLVALVAGFGFYRGWFSVAANNADDKSKFTLTVDNEKVQIDRKAATEKAADLGAQAKDQIAGPGGTTDASATAEKVDSPKNRIGDEFDTQAANRHEGTVVSVGDELKMMDNEGNEHGHTVAANVTVTCDGKASSAADLKPGMKIRVTTDSATPNMVTRIEALDRSDTFETS